MFESIETDDSMNDQNCALCLNNFGEAKEKNNKTKVVDKIVMRLRLKENLNRFKQDEQGCDHVFHTEYINPWFAIKTTCPLCKRDKK